MVGESNKREAKDALDAEVAVELDPVAAARRGARSALRAGPGRRCPGAASRLPALLLVPG